MGNIVLKEKPDLVSKKLWWGFDVNDLCLELKTNIQNGLTSSEAKNRLKEFGLNQLPEQKRVSPFKIFLRQFSNFIIWVLIVAAIIALATSFLLQLAVIYLPFFQKIFGTVSLGIVDWVVVFSVVLAVYFICTLINNFLKRNVTYDKE